MQREIGRIEEIFLNFIIRMRKKTFINLLVNMYENKAQVGRVKIIKFKVISRT